MVKQPLKPCAFPMCGKLTDKLYCESHANHRPSRKANLYNSEWRKRRANYLMRNPFCVDPFGKHKGRQVVANVVDHKLAHKGNKELFWNEDNWQSLCTSCHNTKTAKYDMGNWGV